MKICVNIFKYKFKRLLIFILFFLLITLFILFVKIRTMDTRSLPFVIIANFEERYIQDKNILSFLLLENTYEFIETIDFELFDKKQLQSYLVTKNNNKGIVFSFVNINAPINFSLTVYDEKKEIEAGKGGFSKDTAVYVKLSPNSTCEFEYMLGFKDVNLNIKNLNLVESVTGKINVYKVK